MADLTEAEAAVYDRQLRVWGVEVQKRLSAARVLIIGCSGLAAEVAKNIVLAGVGSLHLLDDTPCSTAPPGNFLVPANADPNQSVASVSAATLHEMNPLVKLSAREGPATASKDLIADYDLVLIVGRPLGSLVLWDTLCRDNKVAFFAGISRGGLACFFSDLGSHSYSPVAREGQEQAAKTIEFCSLVDALGQSLKGANPRKTHKLLPVLKLLATKEGPDGHFLQSGEATDLIAFGTSLAKGEGTSPKLLDQGTLEAYLGCPDELPPVNAIVGGVLANEMLKAVSCKGEPFCNLFCYSMLDGQGIIERLAPPEKSFNDALQSDAAVLL